MLEQHSSWREGRLYHHLKCRKDLYLFFFRKLHTPRHYSFSRSTLWAIGKTLDYLSTWPLQVCWPQYVAWYRSCQKHFGEPCSSRQIHTHVLHPTWPYWIRKFLGINSQALRSRLLQLHTTRSLPNWAIRTFISYFNSLTWRRVLNQLRISTLPTK